MTDRVYDFRTLRRRALWLPLCSLAIIFGVGIYAGHAATGWLLGMSAAVIVITGEAFGAASAEPRFWTTLTGYALAHLILLAPSTEAWIPEPTFLITPLFMLDYLAMGLAFPKLSGLRFNMS
jgi:uncharacterized membrane protein AbrB (regulator of aidB expression)